MRDRVPYRTPGRAWVKRRPFVGAYEKGRLDARNEEDSRSHLIYTNRGWGHQFMTAYDQGYRDQRRELAHQKRLELE